MRFAYAAVFARLSAGDEVLSAHAGLQQLIFNFNGVKNQVSGPVAIVAAGAEVARIDFAGLYQFAAIVSINLAVVNALPLPALDGGYMLLLVRSHLAVLWRNTTSPAPSRPCIEELPDVLSLLLCGGR